MSFSEAMAAARAAQAAASLGYPQAGASGWHTHLANNAAAMVSTYPAPDAHDNPQPQAVSSPRSTAQQPSPQQASDMQSTSTATLPDDEAGAPARTTSAEDVQWGPGRKSAATIRAQRQAQLPQDFPTGPWSTCDDAKDAINSYGKDPSSGGGGWSVSYSSGIKHGTSKAGPTRQLGCHRGHASTKHGAGKGGSGVGCGCLWSVTLEKALEGWVIRTAHLDHNHSLPTTAAQMNAFSSLRNLPQSMTDTMQLLSDTGLDSATLDLVLRKWAKENNVQQSWSIDDIRHR